MTPGGDRNAAPPLTDDRDTDAERQPRSAFALGVILALAALLFAGFAWLGVWQVHRRTWKLALIDHVDHATRQRERDSAIFIARDLGSASLLYTTDASDDKSRV